MVQFFCLIVLIAVFIPVGQGYQHYANQPHWPPPEQMNYRINPSHDPGFNEIPIITAAAQSWENSVDFDFNYLGTTGIASSGVDGTNVIYWHAGGAGGVLGYCQFWYWTPSYETFEADIWFDSMDAWWDRSGTCSGLTFDLQSVCAHEMGHALGLDHEAQENNSCPLMQSLIGPCVSRDPCQDDIDGATYFYGIAGPSPTPDPMPVTSPAGIGLTLLLLGSAMVFPLFKRKREKR